MKYYRCKCGKCTAWSSGGEFPLPCEGCTECGMTLETHPDLHRETEEHELRPVYDRYTGNQDGSECSRCYKRIKE